MAEPKPPLAAPTGSDERNLAEFPFALLTRKPGEGDAQTRVYRDGDREWTISGAADCGLPTAADEAVYVALMELARQQGFPQRVTFSRRDLLCRAGWQPDGAAFARLTQSLKCLVGVTVFAKNAFWNAKQGKWMGRAAFHILEEYGTLADRDELDGRPKWWTRFSPRVYQNLRAGYTKDLDTTLFRRLTSAIARRLYRYLDGHRLDGKASYQMGLAKLAHEHLGLSRDYYPSQLKRELDRAHRELVATGFLSRAAYGRLRGGGEKVIYHFPRRGATGTRGALSGQQQLALWWEEQSEAARQAHTEAALAALAQENPTLAEFAQQRPDSEAVRTALAPHLLLRAGIEE